MNLNKKEIKLTSSFALPPLLLFIKNPGETEKIVLAIAVTMTIVAVSFLAAAVIVARRTILRRSAQRKEKGEMEMENKIVEIVLENEHIELEAKNGAIVS